VLTVPSIGRSYRGAIQTGWGPGGVQLINQLDLESYLKGMGEVLDGSWPLAALETQAIAARTYVLRAMATSGQICADDRCQVYLGAQVEYPAMEQAVDATAHEVLTYGGQLVSALYSANGGGFEADPAEAFGPTGAQYPYLRPAPYETLTPMPWNATIALADIGSRLGCAGQVTGVAVTQKGPSGRATQVTITGTRGVLQVPGFQFAADLGLRSTLFSPMVGTAATRPPPPPTGSLIQEPPGAVVDPAVPQASVQSARADAAGGQAAGLVTALGALGLVGLPAGRLAWRRRRVWRRKAASPAAKAWRWARRRFRARGPVAS
jgi:stage II sporulation protein D